MSDYNNEDMELSTTMDFATDEVEPDSFEVLPTGNYPTLIEKVSVKSTKDGTGKRVNVQLKITDGQYAGRVVFDGLNVVLPNSPKAENIGRKQLAGLLDACGIKGERDLAKLVQTEQITKIDIQEAKGEYEARNFVRGYKPLPGRMAVPSSPSTTTTVEKKTPSFMHPKAGGPPALVK